MELNIARPYIETSGQMEEQMFSIQDQGMIFDILRNKMYSNNILAICREISCNARDAHREVGKEDVPTEITLPNHLEPFYKIKDFGPGISPDRMANVFIKYTASTKRGDNIQTGGFGLGAKTPFAYSDTFTIVTNVDGVQYNYACFIDETRVGKLILLNTAPTDEINGTEIIIPVKSADFRYFSDWTEVSTRHWTTRPIIKGDTNFKWFDHEIVLGGNNWSICRPKDSYNRSLRLIIDAIEYPLEFEALRKYAKVELINSIVGDLHLYFKVGELTLSANREQVYLDDATKEKIKIRLDELFLEVKDKIVQKINDCENLWQANLFYKTEVQTGFNNINVFGRLLWNNIELHNGYAINPHCTVFKYNKGKNSYQGDPNKIYRQTTQSISFEKDSTLYVNDLPLKEPTPKHVKKIFEDNPDLKSVQLICPTDKITVEHLNKSINLDQFDAKLLSSVTKASARAYKPASTRVLVFKFDVPLYKEVGSFSQISYSDIEEDNNTKLLISVIKDYGSNGRVPILSNSTQFSVYGLTSILRKFPDISIYGLDPSIPTKRIEDDFSDFILFEDFVKDKLKNSTVNFVEIKFAATHHYDIDEGILNFLPKIKKLIDDPNSLYLKKGEVHRKLKEASESQNKGLLSTYESFFGEITQQQMEDFVKNNPEYDFLNVNTLFSEKYPLLEHVNTYHKAHLIKEIAQYINLLDKI